MRIHTDDLANEMTLKIQGDEPWLARIYSDFAATGDIPKLAGELKLRLEEGGSVKVSGKVSYAPVVNCGRCDQAITWPLSLSVDVRFLPAAYNDTPREKALSRAELDAYYLEDQEVDLEGLLNDVIQTGLPSRLIPVGPDGKSCRVCKVDLSSDQVYGAGKDDKDAPESPFAALKGLKLPN